MKIHIKVNEGRIVRDPETKEVIPAAGIVVEKNSFWIRRIQAGDVSLAVEKEIKNSQPKQGNK